MPRTLLVTTRKTEKKGSHVPIVLAFLAGGILTKVLDVPIALNNNVVIISSPSASQAEPTTPQLDRDAPKELDTRGLSYNNASPSSSTQEQAQTAPHSVRPKIVYGHVHMAKTAGSTINGYLANHFDFVCGNKGNTHDYYNQNERQKSKCGGANKNCRTIDSFHKQQQQRRLDVNRKYVECDYISVEMGWQFWTQLDNPSQLPMELHVPCRDPVRHLMSMCNHYGKVYNCSEPDIATAVQHCMGYQNRFSMQLLNQQGIHVMCFESNPPHAYLQYMSDGKLVPRRHVSSPFVVREETHAKNSNCIYDFPTLMGQVHDHMVTHYDYFRYCKDCIGSEQDLLQRRPQNDHDN